MLPLSMSTAISGESASTASVNPSRSDELHAENMKLRIRIREMEKKMRSHDEDVLAGLEASPDLLEAARTYGRLQTLASKAWWVGDPYRKRVNSKVSAAKRHFIKAKKKLSSACEELRVFSQMDGEAEEKMKEAFGWIRRPAKRRKGSKNGLPPGVSFKKTALERASLTPAFSLSASFHGHSEEEKASHPDIFAQYHPRLVHRASSREEARQIWKQST